MRVKTKEGKSKDMDILNITPDNYIVPAREENLYHCRIEVEHHDSKTGKRLSKPRIQKFGKKSFETSILHELRQQGYTVDILHNPNDYDPQAKQEELLAAKQAEKEKIKAEIAAEMEAKIRAEVLAEMESKGKGKGKGKDSEDKTESKEQE